MDRRVDLPSGGYLIIDYAEALTVIDVNSGSFIGRGKGARLEDTILRTNMEAAEAVVNELRLRDIGGIIVIDFIDMARARNRTEVLKTLRKSLEEDRTKTFTAEISKLGLVEMTRQNVTEGVREIMSRPCPTCDGEGVIKSEETIAIEFERRLRDIAKQADADIEAFLVRMNPRVVVAVHRRQGARSCTQLEEETGRFFHFEGSEGLPLDHFDDHDGGHAAGGRRARRSRGARATRCSSTIVEPHMYNVDDAVAKIDGYVISVTGAGSLVGEKKLVRLDRRRPHRRDRGRARRRRRAGQPGRGRRGRGQAPARPARRAPAHEGRRRGARHRVTATATRPGWLSDELFPFESRWVEAHGTRLHHVDEGDASLPTLLLVHGNPTWSFLYREIILGLRDRFRCVALDLPGFGLSEPPEGFRFTPLEHALALERFVLELDLTDVTLLTQDWGGPTGFAVAGWHPDRFASFVVGNTWAWPMDKRGTGTWSAFFSSPLGSRLMRDQAVQRGARRRTLTDEEVAHYRRPARLDAVKGLARGVSGAKPFLAEVERGLRAARRPPGAARVAGPRTWPSARASGGAGSASSETTRRCRSRAPGTSSPRTRPGRSSRRCASGTRYPDPLVWPTRSSRPAASSTASSRDRRSSSSASRRTRARPSTSSRCCCAATRPSSTRTACPRSRSTRGSSPTSAAPKLVIFKYRPKQGYKKKNGHRQDLTRLEITEIKHGS